MYKIATLNKISPVGLARLTDGYTVIDNTDEANGILVRSQAMHDMEFSKDLLAIARAGAGVNNIPLDRCAQEGIVVFNTPGANANAVKELVIAGMLLAARNIPEGLAWAKTLAGTENVGKAVEKGKGQFAGTEIKGKTLGVIGLGAIGVMVANAAEDLGMDVIGYDPFLSVKAAHNLSNTIQIVDALKDLYPKCDYISIHVPAMDSTNKMINADAFAQMKDGVIFLNFSRDKLMDDDALEAALASGKVKKYITDFTDDRVINFENVIVLPHLGASSAEAEDNCASMAVDQIMDYIENGNIVNSVNFPACSLGPVAAGTSRLCVIHKNAPSALEAITGLGLSTSNMINKSKGDYAYTLVEVTGDVAEDDVKGKLSGEDFISVRVVK
ncbi:3-phosphoglycerate dehydrogenase family protein [bacterium 210820-DFI.6.37]|nr:3-phosphoglycerate dehydrogenase family protein [bacterium 210820-DFI.6.37]